MAVVTTYRKSARGYVSSHKPEPVVGLAGDTPAKNPEVERLRQKRKAALDERLRLMRQKS